MLRARSIVLLSLCCCVPDLVRAADTGECRNGSFPMQGPPFGLAKVDSRTRTYLRSDLPPCPDESAACHGRAYVVPGDTLLTGMAIGPYICAFFPGGRGSSAGYVRQDEIAAQPLSANVSLVAWVGEWRDGDDTITLRIAGLGLAAEGSAYWPSARPSLKERPGGPNLGDMSGMATPNGNTVVFAETDPSDCRVRLTLLPPYLLAADNRKCGGMNVSFTGVYRKR
jgi:hypothetical protein